MRPQTLPPLVTYDISLSTFAASPTLAKETVYMPSKVAARLLGTRTTISCTLPIANIDKP